MNLALGQCSTNALGAGVGISNALGAGRGISNRISHSVRVGGLDVVFPMHSVRVGGFQVVFGTRCGSGDWTLYLSLGADGEIRMLKWLLVLGAGGGWDVEMYFRSRCGWRIGGYE